MSNEIPSYKLGWIPDTYDHRDYKFVSSLAPVKLPSYVDLRDQCPEIYDQLDLGSCTAQSVAAVMQFNQIKQGHEDIFIPSRLFIYYNARVAIGTENEDSGAMLRDAIKTSANEGSCPEFFWPYITSKFAIKPTPILYETALNYQTIKYERIGYDLNQMKACLAEGYPFVFGVSVYRNFPINTKTGDIPMPPWFFPGNQGGHAMVAVGYDDSKSRFIIRNSWGEGWGNEGYGTIPYRYLANPMHAGDFWVIKLVEKYGEY